MKWLLSLFFQSKKDPRVAGLMRDIDRLEWQVERDLKRLNKGLR